MTGKAILKAPNLLTTAEKHLNLVSERFYSAAQQKMRSNDPFWEEEFRNSRRLLVQACRAVASDG